MELSTTWIKISWGKFAGLQNWGFEKLCHLYLSFEARLYETWNISENMVHWKNVPPMDKVRKLKIMLYTERLRTNIGYIFDLFNWKDTI